MAVHPGLISLNKLRIEQSLLVCVSIYIWGLKRKKTYNQNLCENKSIQDRRGEKELK